MNTYTITDHEFDLISRLVYNESGINLTDSKKQLVVGRLGKRLRVLGLSSFNEYYAYVKGRDGEHEITNLLDCISTNKTDFFREPAQFEFLRKEVIPKSRNLKIWSAACSTGEEPYSIAITMLETLAKTDLREKILASDISTKVLDAADKGVYEAERLKPIPPDVLKRYFLKGIGENAGIFKVKRHLREVIVYKRINLMENVYQIKTVFDIIFFRNAMIYFDKPTQKEVIAKLSKHLVDGGYLFLGHSETLHGVDCGFNYVRPNVYRKG